MAGHAITVSGAIAAPRDRVWQVLTDLDNATMTIPSISAVERLTDGPYAVGIRWRETAPCSAAPRRTKFRWPKR